MKYVEQLVVLVIMLFVLSNFVPQIGAMVGLNDMTNND